MKYFVFEAGGRAGLSAELFFLGRAGGPGGDLLVLADMDESYRKCPAPGGVVRVTEAEALAMISETPESCFVFPADELARQGKEAVFALASGNPLSAVEKWFYDKHEMNLRLSAATAGCEIRIPETFALEDVFIRPNTMSAGSHGVAPMRNTCVTRRIDVAREYVIDMEWVGSEPSVYAREVKIKNGYDRYLCFLPSGSRVHRAAEEFIRALRKTIPLMVTGIFHVQLMEDRDGGLYFVEYSKRISGTSAVNLFRGYNPFDALAGVKTPVRMDGFPQEGVWYRYEDLVMKLHRVLP